MNETNNSDVGEQEVFADFTVYHVPKNLLDEFKEFCRLNARGRFAIGLSLLLTAFKEKEAYYNLVKDLAVMRQELNELNARILKEDEKDNKKAIMTFGGELSNE
jgi:hypothetical protein